MQLQRQLERNLRIRSREHMLYDRCHRRKDVETTSLTPDQNGYESFTVCDILDVKYGIQGSRCFLKAPHSRRICEAIVLENMHLQKRRSCSESPTRLLGIISISSLLTIACRTRVGCWPDCAALIHAPRRCSIEGRLLCENAEWSSGSFD